MIGGEPFELVHLIEADQKAPQLSLEGGSVQVGRIEVHACALMEQVLLEIAGSKVRICFHAWLKL